LFPRQKPYFPHLEVFPATISLVRQKGPLPITFVIEFQEPGVQVFSCSDLTGMDFA
jgi:hypothetical protein